jgi:nicotinamidase-related amidase
MKKKVFIIVDMQEDFVNGALGTPEAKAIVENVKKRAEKLREDGAEVFFTKDTHGNDYLKTFEGKHLPVSHCIMYSDGWKIISELNDIPGIYVTKTTFGYDDWKSYLGEEKDIKEIELAGVCTDICVVTNALVLRMLYPNTKITVTAGCCAGTTSENHEAALKVMESCQIEVKR